MHTHFYMGGTIIPGIAAGWEKEKKKRKEGEEGGEEKEKLTVKNTAKYFIIIKNPPFKYINMFSHLRSCVTEATFKTSIDK